GRPFSSQTRANRISAERHDYPGGDEPSDWGDDSESDGEPERDPYRSSRTDRARPGTDRQTEHLSFSDILKRAPKLPSSATVPRSNTSYRKSMTSKADTDLLTSKLWNCSTDELRSPTTPRLPIGGLKRTKELRSDPGDKQETP
ncbi:unnamed protein product, partial [Aphanomyces euteiches]